MKYSFIVICNKEDKIDKCLKSILSQSYINYEVLLINNDINLNISKLKSKYINDYNNISFYDLSAQSISNCRNFGIKNAKGKFIIYVNGDDSLYNKNVLKNINNYLEPLLNYSFNSP